MKYYAQFLTCNLNNEIVEALGTDGVFVLDGRKSLENMSADAQNQAYFLRSVQKFVGYQIVRGSRFDFNNPVEFKHLFSYKIRKV